MRGLSFRAMLWRALRERRARSLSALVALTVLAGVSTALATLYADLNAKMHTEFRRFGANIVVRNVVFDAQNVGKGQQAAGADATVVPFAYAVATTDRGTPVVVAGTEFAGVRKLDSWWKVERWPEGADAALLGQKAAEFVGNERRVTLTFGGKVHTFAGAGRLTTGGDEDSRIYVPLEALEAWTGVQPSVLEVEVPGGREKVEAALARLRAALPGAEVEPVRQLVDGESRIVDRTHALMLGAVVLIALTVGVSVLATLSASVLERRRDFALMKALGGGDWELMRLFVAETLVLAAGGVAAGWVLGSGAALAISELNFHTATLPRVGVLPVVVAMTVGVAAVAAVFPVRSLRRVDPAGLLKGE